MSGQKTTRRDFLKQTGLAVSVLTLAIQKSINSRETTTKTESRVLKLIRESTTVLYNLKEQRACLKAYSLFGYPRTIYCI
jgi:hypothetical protein